MAFVLTFVRAMLILWATLVLVAPRTSLAGPVSPAEITRTTNTFQELMEYVLNAKLTPAERTQLSQQVSRDFQADPALARKERQEVEQALPRMRRVKGADRVAVRKDLLTAIYFASQNPKPQDAESAKLLLQIIDAHNPVVGVDNTNKKIITRRDVQGVVSSNNFTARVAGIAQVSSMGNVSPEQIQGQMASLPAAVKANLFKGEERYARLQEVWQTLTPSRKKIIVQAIQKQAKTPQQIPRAARELESGLIRRAELVAEQRRARARQVAQARARRRSGSSLRNKEMEAFGWHLFLSGGGIPQ